MFFLLLSQLFLSSFFIMPVQGDIFTDIEDPVDNDTSDEDLSPDVGSSSNFTAQKYGPDSEFDVLTEAGVGSALDDYVDSDSSDEDVSPDKGSHSNFNNEKAADSNYDTLTEEDTSSSEWLDCNAYDSTYSNWLTFSGSTPYLDAQDEPTNEVYEDKTGGEPLGWFDFPSTSYSGSGLTVNVSLYTRCGDTGDQIEVYLDYTGGAGALVATFTPGAFYGYNTQVLAGTYTAAEVNSMRIYVNTVANAKANGWWVDHLRLGVSKPTNNELDLEVQFTSVDTTYDTTKLCIKSGATGAEDINVNIRNTTAGSWDLLFSDINTNGWANTTITDYVASTITLQFKGGTETSDNSQDTWEIDAVLLRQSNQTYQLDLEVQWTSVDYDEANERPGLEQRVRELVSGLVHLHH
jgi:hypothetical protein